MKLNRVIHLLGTLSIMLACLSFYLTSLAEVPAVSSALSFCTVFFALLGLILLGLQPESNVKEPTTNPAE